MQNGAQSRQASSADDDDVMAGGLGMFEEEQGKDESWAAPQSMQKAKPKKLTGPWGDYGGPAGGPAPPRTGKKRPGKKPPFPCCYVSYELTAVNCLGFVCCLWLTSYRPSKRQRANAQAVEDISSDCI